MLSVMKKDSLVGFEDGSPAYICCLVVGHSVSVGKNLMTVLFGIYHSFFKRQ